MNTVIFTNMLKLFWVFMIEMSFIFTCSQRRLLFLYSLKVDYLKYLPANIVASHTHYDKEGNSYSMGTCIAEKGKTKYVLFKVPGGSKYAVIISVSWCTLLFLIVRNLFKSMTSRIKLNSACMLHRDLRVAYFDLDLWGTTKQPPRTL